MVNGKHKPLHHNKVVIHRGDELLLTMSDFKQYRKFMVWNWMKLLWKSIFGLLVIPVILR